jgi:hypothetical protein
LQTAPPSLSKELELESKFGIKRSRPQTDRKKHVEGDSEIISESESACETGGTVVRRTL